MNKIEETRKELEGVNNYVKLKYYNLGVQHAQIELAEWLSKLDRSDIAIGAIQDMVIKLRLMNNIKQKLGDKIE